MIQDELTGNDVPSHHKTKLLSFLGKADTEDFLQLLWAANMLQSETPEVGLRYLRQVPREAVGAVSPDPNAIHKWEVELLANEVLTAPKKRQRKGRRLSAHHYPNVLIAVNILRKLENKDHKVGGPDFDIWSELRRIANRQFPWQTGSANMPTLYRNVFIYGQDVCADVFNGLYGLSIPDFTKVAFGLHGYFQAQPKLLNRNALTSFGVSSELLTAALVPLMTGISDLQRRAITERKKVIPVAYKPSVYRQFPCVNFGGDSLSVRAPIPQLIINRMTSGLYYDVIRGDKKARQEYGPRFETYTLELGHGLMPELEWQAERAYKVNKKIERKTPDVLCYRDGRGLCVVECKATRMSHAAMFGKDPTADRGFKDLVKAVKQIWTFNAHCRAGLFEFPGYEDAPGVVLTLDNWPVMASHMTAKVVETARQEIMREPGGVTQVDMREIVFVPIESLERVLSRATADSLEETLNAAVTPKYQGYLLESVHQEMHSFDETIFRPYPFTDRLGDLLPWWNELGADDD